MTGRQWMLSFLIMFTVASAARAQDLTKTGTTAAAFSKIGVGARPIGMGGAFVATADDLTAIYWNPGGLASTYGSEAYFNHVNWFADVRVDFAGFSTRLSDIGVLGVFVTVMRMDEMAVRTLEMPEGTGERFNAGGLILGLTYARNLTEQFSIGANFKYIREYIWNSTATGIALDVGTLYRIPVLNELRLGASIANFGTKMRMEGRDNATVTEVGEGNANLINTEIQLGEFDLPLLFRIGVAVDAIKGETFRLTAAVDAIHPNDNTEYLNTGLEFAWNEIVFLRAGMKSLLERDTEQGFTLGAGLNYRVVGSVRLAFDYAYQDWGRLTNVHYLGFGIKF
ncbi:MAG: PorV/PorQ family protein [Bacteroidetes bacterium]|nr:PorV/PorQ family protein [Bacteroidota bacterium]